ncbi:hypothetical protein ACPWQS_24085, partial [Pandoraea pneumonica]|uniref:hypothetical protein n=1 Tax=Pandoraea pneumonica TaxID=2508299 RepID=UPI003CE69777
LDAPAPQGAPNLTLFLNTLLVVSLLLFRSSGTGPAPTFVGAGAIYVAINFRSEERRVGTEWFEACRSRGAPEP